ncbi:MAG: non-homologous end-joining DNA ligase [Thermoleophilaceae bacterium]
MAAGELDIGGRRLAIRNLDRVIFPRSGTTKAAILDYYVRIADAMLPHLRDRLLHMHRYPEGVEGPRFWQKDCPDFRPAWIPTAPVWSRDKQENIDYCVIEELAGLLWAVNIGSIELHTSLHRRDDLDRPTVLAFDLDPGDGAGMPECCAVALRLRELVGRFGLECFPKTSGSKGLQVYVPLNSGEVTYETTKPLARKVAEVLEAETPDAVVSRMKRELRAGKVLVDWSQNTTHKSMVCVYSVRAKERPTVSTPVTWDEVEGDPHALAFEMGDVLERVEQHGDLFAPVLSLTQSLDRLADR